MKNPMMQKVTLALSCAAVGLAVFDMTVKDARIHELTEERDIYASRFQNWSERAMRDEEAISERDDLLDKLLGEMDAVLNGEIKFEDAGEFHCTAYPHCRQQRRRVYCSASPQRDHRLYPHSAARAGRKRADQRICRYLREMGKLAKRYAGLRGKGWNVPSRSHPSRKAGRCDYG